MSQKNTGIFLTTSHSLKQEVDGEFFIIKPYRVVVPSLNLSFREGEWLVKKEDCLNEDYSNDEEFDSNENYGFDGGFEEGQFPGLFCDMSDGFDPWESRGKVIIIYDEDETDIEKIIDYTTAGVIYTVSSYLRKCKIEVSEIESSSCFIETDEFIDENTAFMFLPEDEE